MIKWVSQSQEEKEAQVDMILEGLKQTLLMDPNGIRIRYEYEQYEMCRDRQTRMLRLGETISFHVRFQNSIHERWDQVVGR